MRAEIESVVNEIKESLSLLQEASLTRNRRSIRLAELDREAENPNFWNDSARAQGLMRERQQLESSATAFARFTQRA